MSCLTSQCFENALLPAAPLCYGIGQVDKRTVLADGVWYVVCEISGIKVLKLDTYQGRLSPSPNHCTIIAPLIVASCLQEAKSFLWSYPFCGHESLTSNVDQSYWPLDATERQTHLMKLTMN